MYQFYSFNSYRVVVDIYCVNLYIFKMYSGYLAMSPYKCILDIYLHLFCKYIVDIYIPLQVNSKYLSKYSLQVLSGYLYIFLSQV